MQRRWTPWIIALAATAGLGSCAGTLAGEYTVTGMSPLARFEMPGASPPRLRVQGVPEAEAAIDAPRYFVATDAGSDPAPEPAFADAY